jgi:hypothetical protein
MMSSGASSRAAGPSSLSGQPGSAYIYYCKLAFSVVGNYWGPQARLLSLKANAQQNAALEYGYQAAGIQEGILPWTSS